MMLPEGEEQMEQPTFSDLEYQGKKRDDPQTLRYVRDALARAGYAPIVTGDPQEATSLVRANDPHLVLLDLMLPGTDGIELMGDILDMADVPVIFLSAYGQEEIIARAFENGADDYVVKPFSPTELVARIKAALRKREAPEWAEPSEPYVFGELTIDYAERRVTLAGHPVQLTAIEYGLLFELSANAGRVMTYDRLLQRVWGLRGSGDARRVRTAAKQLRRKLGDDANNPTYILNEPRVGYRMALFQKCDLFQKSGFCSKSPNEAAKISVAVPDCHLVQGSAYSRIFQQNGVLVPVQFSP